MHKQLTTIEGETNLSYNLETKIYKHMKASFFK